MAKSLASVTAPPPSSSPVGAPANRAIFAQSLPSCLGVRERPHFSVASLDWRDWGDWRDWRDFEGLKGFEGLGGLEGLEELALDWLLPMP